MSARTGIIWSVLLVLALSGCRPVRTLPTATPPPVIPTALPSPVPPPSTATPTPVRLPSPIPTATLAAVTAYEPAGCLHPPDDLARETVNGWMVNRRTLAMLKTAQSLYGGPIDLAGAAITQGSYHDNGAASFGTHLGGGAVDLAIFIPGTWTVDFADLPRLVRALRAAGFAAWVRDLDEVYPGSGYHIHAIAVGDPELSAEAEAQLTGTYGYFRGYNGLPQADGVPVLDRDGGPLLCGWMADLGYRDLSAAAQPASPWPSAGWPARLQAAARALAAQTPPETAALAARLGVRPLALAGPLAGELWRQAGLLPGGTNPLQRSRAFLAGSPGADQFERWLPPEDYLRLRLDPSQNPLAQQPLFLGDLLVLGGGQARFLVITGLDEQGRAYSLEPSGQLDGSWRIQRVLVADPNGPGGLWETWKEQRIQTLDVFRYRQPRPGDRLEISVQPGDSLPRLAARFGLSVEDLIRANAISDPGHLQVGQLLRIVIPQ